MSIWELCRHPQVGVAMSHWLPLCGHVCFKPPGHCVSSQKHQPRHLRAQRCGALTHPPTCLRLHGAFLCLALELPLHPKTPGDPSYACPGDEATASPSWHSSLSLRHPLLRLPSRTDGFAAAPGRSLHPHVRLLFVSLLTVRRPRPVPPAPLPPVPPGAAPTGASHTYK